MKFNKALPALLLVFTGVLFCGTANAQRPATATATVVNGFLIAITVTDGGAGYTNPPAVAISGGGGSGAKATATISNGAVTQVVVANTGSGYATSPKVVIDSPFPNRPAIGTATVVNGFVVSITVNDGGAGYASAPSVSIAGGDGSGATAMATVLNGAVDKIIVKTAGGGYSGTPTVVIAAPPSSNSPFADGLVAYYPFSGDPNDQSGNGNDGIVNGATLGTDRFGMSSNSYVFRATGVFPTWTGDYISTVAANEFPVAAEDFCVALWVSISSNSPDYQILFCNRSVNQFQLAVVPLTGPTQLNASHGELWFHTGSAYEPVCRAAADWVLHHWYHVAVVRASNTITLYRDGAMLARSVTALGNNAAPDDRILFFGYRTNPANHPLWGQLDDIRVYHRALSDQEVADLYFYEAPEQPWLTINVKTVEVTMHVKPTRKYQLQASLDLQTWTNIGDPFVANTSEIVQELDAIQVGRFFRLAEMQ